MASIGQLLALINAVRMTPTYGGGDTVGKYLIGGAPTPPIPDETGFNMVKPYFPPIPQQFPTAPRQPALNDPGFGPGGNIFPDWGRNKDFLNDPGFGPDGNIVPDWMNSGGILPNENGFNMQKWTQPQVQTPRPSYGSGGGSRGLFGSFGSSSAGQSSLSKIFGLS